MQDNNIDHVLYHTIPTPQSFNEQLFRKNLINKLLASCFSLIIKSNYIKIDNYDLYYNTKIYELVKATNENENKYHCYSLYESFYPELIIFFDKIYKNKFILAYCNTSANDNYRIYYHIEINKYNQYNIKQIPEFEEHYNKLWYFDNRNKNIEILTDDKLFIFIYHRDRFENNSVMIIHDINSCKRWLYNDYVPFININVEHNIITIYNNKFLLT